VSEGIGDDSCKDVESVLNKVFTDITKVMIFSEHKIDIQHLYLLQVISVKQYAVKNFRN
jgi:hypothetical protein